MKPEPNCRHSHVCDAWAPLRCEGTDRLEGANSKYPQTPTLRKPLQNRLRSLSYRLIGFAAITLHSGFNVSALLHEQKVPVVTSPSVPFHECHGQGDLWFK